MRRCVSVIVLLAGILPAWAAPPKLEIPAEVRPSGQYVTFIPTTDAKAVVYVGLDAVDPVPSAVLKDARTFLLDTRGMATGRYRFAAVGALGDEQTRTDFAVVLGTPPPVPPGPVPPGPTPPTPPLPTTGLSVLIVEETAKRSELPAAQLAVLFDKGVRDYLNAKCVADPAVAGWKAFRIYDKDVDLTNDGPLWKGLMARPRQAVPWVVIASDKGVLHEGPLPADVNATLELLKKYGG